MNDDLIVACAVPRARDSVERSPPQQSAAAAREAVAAGQPRPRHCGQLIGLPTGAV